MSFIFTAEQEENTLRLMESITTAREAVGILLDSLEKCNMAIFTEVAKMLEQLLRSVEQSGMSYQGKPMEFELVDSWGLPMPEDMLYVKHYCSNCRECAMKLICNGCSDCGRCGNNK